MQIDTYSQSLKVTSHVHLKMCVEQKLHHFLFENGKLMNTCATARIQKRFPDHLIFPGFLQFSMLVKTVCRKKDIYLDQFFW